MIQRQGDKPRLVVTGAGFLFVGIGIYLHSHGLSEYATIAIMVLGGVLIRGDSIVDLVKAWRSRNGNAIKRRRTTSEHEGVEPT